VNRSLGTWKARHFIGIIVEGRPTAGTVDETMLLRRPVDKSWPSRQTFFSLAAACPSVRNRGTRQGKDGARQGLSHDGPVQEGEREEGEGGSRELLKRQRRTSTQ